MRSKQPSLFSINNIVLLVTSLIATFIFYQLAILVLNHEIGKFDDRGYFIVRQYASPFVDKLMLWATFLGDTKFVLIPVVGLFIYNTFIHPHKWDAIKVLVISIGCTAINTALKYLFGRERPLHDHMVEVSNLSFPSGHAMFSMAFYGAVIYFVTKGNQKPIIKIGMTAFLVVLILSIGISRVYLGVHYTSDVVAGFAAGYIWLVAVLVVTDWLALKVGGENWLQGN